jgi:ABC-type branched-subunit amino acid transport system substrate-binding protein
VAQDPSRLPPRGRQFAADYRREFGAPPDRFAAYGHAAMSMLLDAIRRAAKDADDRERVVEETLATTGFESAVGDFSIDRNGDTSLDRLAGYRVRDGRLVLAASLRGSPAPAAR